MRGAAAYSSSSLAARAPSSSSCPQIHLEEGRHVVAVDELVAPHGPRDWGSTGLPHALLGAASKLELKELDSELAGQRGEEELPGRTTSAAKLRQRHRRQLPWPDARLGREAVGDLTLLRGSLRLSPACCVSPPASPKCSTKSHYSVGTPAAAACLAAKCSRPPELSHPRDASLFTATQAPRIPPTDPLVPSRLAHSLFLPPLDSSALPD
jgi:hypothetical protein